MPGESLEQFIMRRVKKTQKHINPRVPLISVVVPAFNEEKTLHRTLESLVNQERGDFELIVVDNNSTDRTAKIARSYGARVVHEPQPGVGYARQRGFKEAKGQIIATTDADTILPNYWVGRILKEFTSNKRLVAFGGLYTLYSGPSSARLAIRYFAYWGWFIDRMWQKGWSLPGANMAVRALAFKRVGGFNVRLTLGEDSDLSQRLKKVGQVKLDRKFKVKTSGRRYRRGLLKGLVFYIPNAITRMVFRKHKFLDFPAIR